ncbi:MAG: 30S ribosomal protein S12 methylthiotransferase RimO [Oscillospiraceae bacterium]|nr:30S ribosomal protein S12 methylthiotransferase RimO [Oscillospiraceae bacterium]
MAEKIGLISLGCAKNLVDSEHMLAALDDAGYEVTGEIENTLAVVINTCGFLASAREEALENVAEVAALKEEGKVGKIIVTGCLAERDRESLFEQNAAIDALVGCGSYHRIAEVLERVLKNERVCAFDELTAEPLEASRILTTPHYVSYLKIAEGCNNRCSYCVIPSLRGPYRSRAMEDILEEAKGLAASGTKELIVIAQDTSRYGTDCYGKRSLAELLQKLCEIEELQWIRVHYLYPDEIDDELIDVIANEEKIVKYLDIPIQHVNDRILSAMNRRGDHAYLDGLFTKLRERIPGVVLRTSLIAGLPGETDEEFEELCDFLSKHKLERVGVFPYFPEPGSVAADLPDQVEDDVKEHRVELISNLQDRIMDAFNQSRIGSEVEVVVEGYDRYAEAFFGRTYCDSPEIDGKVFFTADGKCTVGEFVTVRLLEDMDGDLIGERI